MRTLAIAKKELYLYFTTPIAYVAFFATSFIGAVYFLTFTSLFQRQAMQFEQFEMPQMLEKMNVTDMVAAQLIVSMGVVVVLTMPFLTMRLIAEEQRQKTMELLMTAPIRALDIVLGKYIAAFVVLLVEVAIIAIFPFLLTFFATSVGSGPVIDWWTVGSGLLGLTLCGAGFLAIGLFISSLTESQVVAAIISLPLFILIWVLAGVGQGSEGWLRDVATHLSASTHLFSFARGAPALADLVYFISAAVFGLFLTHRAIEARRWA